MSPEQRRGDDLDARSDVPACGIVLYELATEQLPFTSNRPHFPALEAPQRTACILHIARPRGFEPSRGGDPSDAVGDDRRGRPSGQDGPTTKPSAIATSVKHTEDLHRFVVLAEVDEIRKSLEHDAPKATVRDRERTWRRERARERRVDFVDELVPEADAPGFVPSECFVDVRFRFTEDDEDHFEPRMRTFASDQLLNDAASALSSRRSSSSLCHSGATLS